MKPLQSPRSAPAGVQAPPSAPLEPLLETLEAALARIERARDEREREAAVREARAALGQVRERIGEDGDLAALSAFLQSRDERDKSSLARELHDQLGGILTPAKMDLAWLRARLGDDAQYAQRMARLDALIDQAIDLKRRIIEKLRPSLLDHLGLASALKWYVEEQSAKAGIEPHLAIDTGLGRLPPEVEIVAFRVAQEAVDNAVRHSRASHIDLTVERANPGLHMTISDDGIGIEDVRAARRMSRGLAAMRHRVRSLGGELEVHSPSGTGTRIEITIPLDSNGAGERG